MTFGSLFSGVGGFDLGLERAGMQILWQVEYDEQAQQVLRRHWPNASLYGDVREIGAALAPVDLICGGFPCQDLSVAGKRAGLDGDRSGLWHEFHRIISEVAPRWVLIENVPGLLSSNDGRDMAVVLRGLEELGFGWAYRVLDSQYFGVPQRRRRVFIVGHLGDARPAFRALLPVGTRLPGDPAPKRTKGEAVARSIGGGSGKRGWCNDLDGNGAFPVIERSADVGFHENQRGELNTCDIAYQLTGGGGKPGQGYPAVLPGVVGTLSDGAHFGWGLNGQDAYTGRIFPHTASVPRRLSPVECERLQGFPDKWTAEGVDGDGERVELTDSPRYRQMGNAVTVNVAEWIGHGIMAVGAATVRETET